MDTAGSRKRVLFLEMDNSGRSHMAEAILRQLAGDRYEPHSAGPFPVTVRPEAVDVMREIGVDISGQRSRSTREYLGQHFDAVYAVCDGDAEPCPAFPGGTTCWPIPNPHAVSEDARMEAYRDVRESIRALVLETFGLDAQVQ